MKVIVELNDRVCQRILLLGSRQVYTETVNLLETETLSFYVDKYIGFILIKFIKRSGQRISHISTREFLQVYLE